MVMGLSCFFWGVATVATALVTGYGSFMAVRILLGLAEGPAFPAAGQVVSLWIPRRERTFASACFDCCARIGSASAPPLVAWVIIHWGWQTSFVVTGLLAVIYSFVWFALYHEPDKHPKVSKEEIAYIRQDEVVNEEGFVVTTKPVPVPFLFTYKKTLLLFLGYFCYLYYWNMFISWIPAYLVQARGMDLKQMGFAAMMPFLVAIPMEIFGGWAFDKMQHKGVSLNFARRLGMGICMFGGSLTLLMAVNADTPVTTVVWLTLSMSIYSFGASNVWTVPNDIAPYGQAGTIGGTMNTVGQFSGLLAPLLAGFIITAGETVIQGYNNALYLVIGIAVVGGFFYILNDYSRLVPRNAEQMTVKL
jgi:sugar phosphate permease